jgi:hypothetical protein
MKYANETKSIFSRPLPSSDLQCHVPVQSLQVHLRPDKACVFLVPLATAIVKQVVANL